ncbi:hypothetical protein Dsin_013818 [Dipteronia sinensis]|uniref:Uncharacterized protein n=1 Tax=Dipteronia sinensis TaxID=43782 RepID=A0AAE0E982_9ROSI|nr:hypothetical protein Dsin_013818 [Dipteronia sinensis]
MNLQGDHLDPNLQGRIREDEDGSRSGNDNNVGGVGSGDDHDSNEDQEPPRKKYNSHTTTQHIQVLEYSCKEFPHPEDKQRNDLSSQLGMETNQVLVPEREDPNEGKMIQKNILLFEFSYVVFVLFNDELMRMMFLLNYTHSKCHENAFLKQENNRIRVENNMLKEAMRNLLCITCGSLEAITSGCGGMIDFEIEQLKLENAQLKD